jgi:hypothetical protein
MPASLMKKNLKVLECKELTNPWSLTRIQNLLLGVSQKSVKGKIPSAICTIVGI